MKKSIIAGNEPAEVIWLDRYPVTPPNPQGWLMVIEHWTNTAAVGKHQLIKFISRK